MHRQLVAPSGAHIDDRTGSNREVGHTGTLRCLGNTRSLSRGRAAVAVAEVFVAVAAGDTLLLSSSVILFSAAGAGPCC